MQPTMKDIAEEANVSIATVSRVLNQKGGYSQETYRHVLHVIEQTGFSRNSLARAFRTGQTKTIGLLVPDICNEFFARIAREISLWFLKRNYVTLICASDESQKIEKEYFRELQNRSVDGLLYIQGRKRGVETTVKKSVPIVYIDRYSEKSGPCVVSDNLNGGEIAAKALLDRGRSRPLLIRDSCETSAVKGRQDGFLKMMKKNGVEVSVYAVSSPISSVGFQCMKSVLRKKEIFDSVFCTNDPLAMGVSQALLSAGRRIPQDVTVIGFDDNTIIREAFPFVLTIRQDAKQLVNIACSTLLRMMQGEDIAWTSKVVPVQLMDYGKGGDNERHYSN